MARSRQAKPRQVKPGEGRLTPGTSMLVIAASVIAILLASLQAGCYTDTTQESRGPVQVIRNPLW
jgi:hypothetical protein